MCHLWCSGSGPLAPPRTGCCYAFAQASRRPHRRLASFDSGSLALALAQDERSVSLCLSLSLSITLSLSAQSARSGFVNVQLTSPSGASHRSSNVIVIPSQSRSPTARATALFPSFDSYEYWK